MHQEIMTLIYSLKAYKIVDSKRTVALAEWEIAKLFSYNPSSFMEDEFVLNVIYRVYNQIKQATDDSDILETVIRYADDHQIELPIREMEPRN